MPCIYGHGRELGGSSLELVDLSTGKQQTLARARAIMQPFWRRDSRTIRYMRIAEAAQTDPNWLSAHDVSLDGTDKFVRSFAKSQYPNGTWLMGENYVSNFNNDKYTLARLDGNPDQVLLRGRIPSPGADIPRRSHRRGERGHAGVRASGTQPHSTLGFRRYSAHRGSAVRGSRLRAFSLDGRYVYCKGREADTGPQTLYEVPVDGSKPRVVARSDSREVRGAIALSPDGKRMLETVAGVRRAAFVSLDFTDGMTRLLSSSAKP